MATVKLRRPAAPAAIFDALDASEAPHVRALTRVVLLSLRAARAAAATDAWAELIRTGQFDRAIADAVDAQGARVEKAAAEIDTVLAGAFVDAAGSDAVLATVSLAPRLDLVNEQAVVWARERAGSLIVGIDTETRQAIRDSVSRALAGGGRRAAESEIRQMVGLTRQQARSLARYADSLPEGWSDARRAKALERRAATMIRQRAETIARTEVRRASNAGMKALWDDQAAQGLFDRRVAVRYWIVSPDERLCDRCAPMAGQRIAYDTSFVSEARGVDPAALVPLATPVAVEAPPLHPRCRCTMGLDFETLPASELPALPPVEPIAPRVDPRWRADWEDVYANDDVARALVENMDEDPFGIETFEAQKLKFKTHDPLLDGIARARGFDELPTVVSDSGMDDLVAQGYVEFFRGFETQVGVDEWVRGEYAAGTGFFGNGSYYSTARDTALTYANGAEARLVRAALPPDARVLRVDAYTHSDRPANWMADPGRAAATDGYDAIHVDRRGLDDYWIVLNRSILTVVDPG